jgi:glycosyltransferase involved in cell wall biosynthesis
VVAIIEAATVTGPAKNLIQFARAAAPDVRISLVTYTRSGEPGPFAEAARAAGIEVDLVRERGRFDRSAIPQLRRILEQRRPDIVQTHNVKSNFLFRLAGFHRPYRWLGFHHGYTMPDFKQRLYDQLDRWSLRAVRRMITVCEPFADELVRAGVPRGRIHVLHNSVAPADPPDAAETAALRAKLGEGPLILVVGRLSKEKGHADLLEAFARYDGPGRLVLLGGGHERQRLGEQAATLGVADRVNFVGHVANVKPYYFAADLLALPSHSEGSPNVVLEAMATGLPIVATAVGGVPEILTSGETGLVVPPRNPEAFAAAMRQSLTDRAAARRMAEAAREKARREFTPEQYRQRLIAIYRELMAY